MNPVAAIIVPAAVLLLGGCSGAPPVPPPGGPGTAAPRAGRAAAATPFAELATRFEASAVSLEAVGNPRRALDSWKVVAALRPAAAEPRRRVEELTLRLATEAGRRYADGLALLRKRRPEAARRELLLALAADPDHAEALDALVNLVEPPPPTWTVGGGDTFETIAKKRYGDPALAPIVAQLNDLDPDARPLAGTVLMLPDLAPPAAKARGGDSPEAAAEGVGPWYGVEPAGPVGEGPAAGAPTAPGGAPDDDEARFAGAEERRKREKAEESYNAGVRFFVDQKLEEAIRSWEQTLALNPGHPKAPGDIAKARELLQKLEDLR